MTRSIRFWMIGAAALMFAFVAPGVRLLTSDLNGGEIAALRGIFAAALLFAVWVGFCRKNGERLRVSKPALIAGGLVGLSQMLSLLALAMQSTATAASLLYGAPVYALLLNPLLGKKTTRLDAFASMGTALALFVLLQDEGGWTVPGVIFGISSGFALVFVGYVFHRMEKDSDKVLAIAIGSASQMLVLPFAMEHSLSAISASQWAILGGIGILTSAIPSLLLGLAISKDESLIGQTVILSTEPFLQVGLAWIIASEVPRWFGFLGCALHVTVVLIYKIKTEGKAVSIEPASAST